MALDDDVRTLSGVPLFESLADEHLRLLAFGADRLDLQAGHRLYREGDAADTAFVVISGRIGLFHTREDGQHEVGVASRGTILGEYALVAETQRLTDAIAIDDATLLRLDRRSFMRVLREFPSLASSVYDRIAEDLQEMVRRLDELSPHFDS